MNRQLTAWLVTLLVAAVATPAALADARADAREVSAYRLSMATARRVDAAITAMSRSLASDPLVVKRRKLQAEARRLEALADPTDAQVARMEEIQREIEEMPDSVDLSDAGSIDEMVARLDRFPAAVAALRANGLSTREYVKFTMCLMQTELAVGLQRQGLAKSLPPEVAPENAQLVQQNYAELEAMSKRWQALRGD